MTLLDNGSGLLGLVKSLRQSKCISYSDIHALCVVWDIVVWDDIKNLGHFTVSICLYVCLCVHDGTISKIGRCPIPEILRVKVTYIPYTYVYAGWPNSWPKSFGMLRHLSELLSSGNFPSAPTKPDIGSPRYGPSSTHSMV